LVRDRRAVPELTRDFTATRDTRRRRTSVMPIRPVPNNSTLAGSGTLVELPLKTSCCTSISPLGARRLPKLARVSVVSNTDGSNCAESMPV
jgi:hypothetical protein